MTTQGLTLIERAYVVTRDFLKNRGYEIVDDLGYDGIFNYICKDEGVTVLVSTRLCESLDDSSDGFGETLPYPREELEKATIELIVTSDNFPINCPIRYDEVAIKFFELEDESKSKAYIRHHINPKR